MDYSFPNSTGLDSTREPVHQSRVLASTSGNAQTFTLDIKDIKGCPDLSNPIVSGGHARHGLQHSAPLPVLGSNDKSTLHDRLAARKARRSSQPGHERQFLHTEQYKTYRERKRQDIGKDGLPVWPDHIEESFQNALVHIPPMGRRKKTQYGRPRGRNELIAEWIKQDTGEIRCRKQISSHIQVLSNHLKNVPEWKWLTTAREDDNEYGKDDTNYGFYYGSIADQVRLQRQLAQAGRESDAEESWANLSPLRCSLSKLAFELWVGTPGHITQALHNYTRIPNSHTPLPTIPLEDFGNWRDLFPNLEGALQSGADRECDIVLVRSSFALMSDFPPKTSKLGLVLDLDFRSPDHENVRALNEMKYWSSTNTMYLRGRPLRRTEHKGCQSAEFGLVKPFFEADWWASHFTKLTYKKKEAENGTEGQTLNGADEYSRNLFRELSIMQEVFASPFPVDNSAMPRRRMAVLLWVFSQANKGQAGVSSWQKVIPPPSRLGSNSPLAPTGTTNTSLPPLVLDSMVEGSFDGTMANNDFSHPSGEVSTSLSPAMYGQGSYHSGFTPLQNMDHDHLKFYDFTNTGLTPRFTNFTDQKDESFNFDAPIPLVPSLNHSQQIAAYQHGTNMFDHLAGGSNPAGSFPNTQAHRSHNVTEASSPDRRQSLANFDMSTHQMLQAQLDSAQPKDELSSQEDYTMLEPESQASVINHMNNLDLKLSEGSQALNNETRSADQSAGDTMDHERMALCHPSVFESPKMSRPPLLAHNSFAGVLPTTFDGGQTEHDHLGFDTPTRNDFARLIENHCVNVNDDDLFEAGGINEIEDRVFASGNGIPRPRSQPVLRSNVSPVAQQNDVLVLDGDESGSQVKTERE